MRSKVLIFGGGYAAEQIYFTLKNSLRFQPILGSSMENHTTFIDREAVNNLPYSYEKDFIQELNKFLDEQNISFIIPAHDTAALTFMEHEKELHATVVASPYITTKICRYKSLTYETLKGYDFIPQIYFSGSEIVYPVFCKDDVGQGGRNSFLANNKEELLKKQKEGINYVICEFLPGEEITIDCFTDREGRLLFSQPRTRERILNGISGRSRIIKMTDELRYIVESIADRIEFRGYWYIQCKKDRGGKFKLMEISTRFAGTFGLSKNLDVNLPLLALCDFSNMDIEIAPNQYSICVDKSYIDRYKISLDYERVYIDFDDTLVFDRKKYNLEAVRFLYQCINKEIEIILITKHEYDLERTMQSVRMGKELFNEVIIVPQNQSKYEYMNNDKKAIFIDNAFTERKKVKEKLGMATFDVSCIEALLDWTE